MYVSPVCIRGRGSYQVLVLGRRATVPLHVISRTASEPTGSGDPMVCIVLLPVILLLVHRGASLCTFLIGIWYIVYVGYAMEILLRLWARQDTCR